jgi:hypothetical protein
MTGSSRAEPELHFVANRREYREAVGLEVGPWEPVTVDGSSNRASRYRCTTVTQPWPNPEPGATTWKVVAKRESSDETVRWIGRRP